MKKEIKRIVGIATLVFVVFAVISCNDPKPTAPTQRTMTNGTVVKGDPGITQKQLDDMVVVLDNMYNILDSTEKSYFDTNVTVVQVKANNTAISYSGTTLIVAANNTIANIGAYLVINVIPWTDSFQDSGGNTIQITKAANVSVADATAAAARIKSAYDGLSEGSKGNLAGKMQKIEIVAGMDYSADKATGTVRLGVDLTVPQISYILSDVVAPELAD